MENGVNLILIIQSQNNSTKKDVKIYEVDLDALQKKNLVWKSK